MRVIPTSALRFTLMDHFQTLSSALLGLAPGEALPLTGQMLSGALSGAVTTLVVYPLDLARTQLSADVGATRRHRGILDCMRWTTKEAGFRGHYRGLLVSLLEISPYTALSMGGYEYFKRWLPSHDRSGTHWKLNLQKAAVGWTSGLAGSLLCYPLDTVKRQLMLDGSHGFQSKYDGSMINCVRVLHREAGFRAFYNGGLF